MSDDDDLFAEPDDNEKTVIRPNPGGRRSMSAPAPTAVPAPAAAQPMAPAPQDLPPLGVPAPVRTQAPVASKPSESAISAGLTGMNTLNACAATLFSLISRIRNRAQHSDPNTLRQSVVAEVRSFETRALQAQIDPQSVKIARYAICATLDDVVLNTPWGGQSDWAQKSMVGTFHRETVGGDRFYDLLARLEKAPAQNVDMLEFLYMCLSLGFEGRLRVEQGGSDKHMNVRQGLARIIRTQRGAIEHDLSPHWEGLNKPQHSVSIWKPFWISVGVLAAFMATGFTAVSYSLSGATDRVIDQLATLETNEVPTLQRRAPPVIPVVVDETLLKELTVFLKPELDQGIIEVFQDANTITIRIKGKGLFASASDSLKAAYKLPIAHIAEAVGNTKGPVIIAGHSDNEGINTARFKNNLQLSLARAEAVQKAISVNMTDPTRLRSEGRAAKEPIATNGTRDGRATNRRIEILLVRGEQ